MGRSFTHPAMHDVSLEGVLYALADPHRLAIVQRLAESGGALNCLSASPTDLPKSTLSHHYKILRDGGIIRSEWRGTEVINSLRCRDLDGRFPGLLDKILESAQNFVSRPRH